jgi:ABC-type branched-subunit amino acid transport system permease subunit
VSAFLQPGFWVFVLALAGIYGIFALGLQIQYGVGGIMNFGHVGMMAVSAYTIAVLVIKYQWSFWWAALLGVVLAALLGALLGLTTLRLSGDYFAIASIAFAEITRYWILNTDSVTGGTQGTLAIPNPLGFGGYTDQPDAILYWISERLYPLFGDEASRDMSMIIIVWPFLFLFIWISSRLQQTSWARVLRATREDDDVARSLGKNVFRFRLQALIIGAVFGGIAGVFWALQFALLAPEDFLRIVTFYGWMILILAGATRVKGLLVAAIFFGFLYGATRFLEFWPLSLLSSPERAYLRVFLIGLVIVLLMVKRPQGLFGKREEMVLE